MGFQQAQIRWHFVSCFKQNNVAGNELLAIHGMALVAAQYDCARRQHWRMASIAFSALPSWRKPDSVDQYDGEDHRHID